MLEINDNPQRIFLTQYFNSMKTMKKTMMLTIFGLVLLTSCKKYEEGPGFSLRSKKERVANLWKVDYAYNLRDRVITTADYTGDTWEFTKNGNFVERDNGSVDKTGTWEFVNDKEKITIKLPLDTHTYDILKLREKELWLKDAEEELHLIPAN